MKPNITHITKVEARGLWGKYDIEWNPHPDVNILIGINGSGKSTLLKLMDNMMQNNKNELFRNLCTTIYFNDSHKITTNEAFRLSNEKPKHGKYHQFIVPPNFYHVLKKEILNIPFNISHLLIDTFEYNFQSFDKKTLTDIRGVKSQLDWELWLLEKEYISYQLTIGKRIEKVVFESAENNIKEKREEIYGKKNLFIETINRLFSQTNKTIDTNERDNTIIFRQEDLTLTPYQLSSGEKQLLIILMKVLLQDKQPSILIMDEPEISLHIEWQHQLIDCIRALNENCQIIIATHSPSIFSKGWYDKIVRMEDITHPTKVATATNDD